MSNADRDGDARGTRERWYRAVFEHSPDAILLYDDEGTIIDANPRACEYLRYGYGELVGGTIWRFTSGDPEAVRARWKSMAVGNTGTFGGEHVRADGSTYPVRVRVSRVDPGDDVDFVAIIRDVTEQQKREAELEAVRERMEFALESTDSIVYEIDLETGRETRHGPFERIYGLPPADVETTDAFYEHAVHPADRQAVRARQDAVMDGRTESTVVEYRTNPDEGEERWVRSVMTRTGGETPSIVGLSTDISRLKAREADLERQNARLEEFAGVVSHDLRNPLTVAMGRLQLLDEAVDSDQLGPIADALERMNRIIEDVLWLAREGQDIGSTEPVPLAGAVETSWAMVAHDVAADLVVADDLGTIEADHDRLCQAFENLFRNAVEHGGDDVTVRVGALEGGFYVEDDGPGVPSDDRERVFEPGYSTADGGTGFGLSIVRDVLEAHGWTVVATEGTDGGARFEVTDVSRVDG